MWLGQLREILDDSNRYMFDFDVYLPTKKMNLQRQLCWSLKQKRELIKSIIKGVDIQNFYAIVYGNEDRTKTYKIIDGKQRLTTLLDFCDNKFTFKFNEEEYYYNDLPDDIKNIIDSFDIHFNQTYEYYDDLIPDKIKIVWFEQINFLGEQQDIEHIKKLRK